jgi:hypothetical protein
VPIDSRRLEGLASECFSKTSAPSPRAPDQRTAANIFQSHERSLREFHSAPERSIKRLGWSRREKSLAELWGSPRGFRSSAARLAQVAGTGAFLGAGNAAGNDQNIGQGALLGTGAGVLGNAAGNLIAGGAGKVAGVFNPKIAVPTAEDLAAKAAGLYSRAENSGVVSWRNREAPDQRPASLWRHLSQEN